MTDTMTFPPAIPSAGDLEGWCVRSVTNWTGADRSLGTCSLVRTDVDSLNGLLRDLGELSEIYGYRPQSSKIADGTFRWTFEQRLSDGRRVTDMIIANRIG